MGLEIARIILFPALSVYFNSSLNYSLPTHDWRNKDVTGKIAKAIRDYSRDINFIAMNQIILLKNPRNPSFSLVD